jgi:hypothetical protein
MNPDEVEEATYYFTVISGYCGTALAMLAIFFGTLLASAWIGLCVGVVMRVAKWIIG